MNLQELTAAKTEKKYPRLIIPNPNNTVPVAVNLMREGEHHLIMRYNGAEKVIKYVSLTPLNVQLLLRSVDSVIYELNELQRFEITSVKQYLEALHG